MSSIGMWQYSRASPPALRAVTWPFLIDNPLQHNQKSSGEALSSFLVTVTSCSDRISTFRQQGWAYHASTPVRSCRTGSNAAGDTNGYSIAGGSRGRTRVTGHVFNDSATDVVDVYVTAEALDAGGKTVARGITYVSPNIKQGGLDFGYDAEASSRLVKRVRAVTRLPVIAKLAPDYSSLTRVAKAVEAAGADAISMINAPRAMCIDHCTGKPMIC